MSGKYWSNKGNYQELADEQYNELVPSSGRCETVAGELVRSVSKIYYDAFNNGFCNNTSGPLNYLIEYLPNHNKEVRDAFNYLKRFVNGGREELNFDEAGIHLDNLVDSVTLQVRDDETLKRINGIDMYDLSEPDHYYDDEDEDDDYDY